MDYGKVSARDRSIGHLSDAIDQANWLGNKPEAKRLQKQLDTVEAEQPETLTS